MNDNKFFFIANNVKYKKPFVTRKENDITYGQFLSSLWFNQPLYINRDFHYNICNSEHIIIKNSITKEEIHRLYNKLLPETNDCIYYFLSMDNYYWNIKFSLYKNKNNVIYIFCPAFETNYPLHISQPESSSSTFS